VSEWAVAEAKNRFSELITKALTEGPQRVRRRDDSVVVISAAEYERLKPRKDFIEHLLSFPGFGDPEIEREALRRDPDPGRDIDL
jgi:antitoxin Phd